MTGVVYILMIWTVVGASDSHGGQMKAYYDWRPLGEFHQDNWERKYNAQEMCERAAQELGLKKDAYRCVRSK